MRSDKVSASAVLQDLARKSVFKLKVAGNGLCDMLVLLPTIALIMHVVCNSFELHFARCTCEWPWACKKVLAPYALK